MSTEQNNGKPAVPPKRNLLNDRRIRLLLSLLGAVIAWMAVTIVVQPGTTTTIYNVPVDFSYDSAAYTSRGLSIVNAEEKTVNLKLSGDGYTIGSLSANDFVVYPDWSSVRDSGEKSLRLQVRSQSTLLTGVSVSIDGDNTVDVVFDVVEEKTLPIQVTTNYLKIADGYILYGTDISKETVTLSGPSTELSEVETCTAEVTYSGELTSPVTLDTGLRFYTRSGGEVKFEYTTLETDSVEVTLQVYKLATLPVEVSFINAPRDFDPSVLVYSLSKKTLNVAGPESQIDRLSALSVGTIDLSTFALDKVYEMPIVLERGPALDERVKAVEHFSATGELDENANIQFGEGGAGTFSDGKLTTRIGDELCGFVTEVFLEHGAPKEIAWQQKPHVGTDLLRGVITSIRKEIESLGGEVHFNTALTGFERRDGQLVGIQTTDGAFPCEALVFAVGHSARDTFGMLMDSGLVLECKPFSVGFRAEHLQSEIEKSLYHEAAGHPALPRGEYQLSQHVEKRCVYKFCMCPGGQVVASASEKGRVVTNGMSYHARSGRNANAAVVVSVGGEDFGNDPRKAIAFQRELEARAYAAGRPGGEYAAPAENIQSFLEGRGRLNIGRVQPTYDRGVVAADLGALLPTELADTLRAGLRAYERKIAGYTAPEAILTGLETRTSSPVRLKREENFECAQLAGLYPCGEGAGYAGGIMSAAVDGLRVARAIISRYSPAEG